MSGILVSIIDTQIPQDHAATGDKVSYCYSSSNLTKNSVVQLH